MCTASYTENSDNRYLSLIQFLRKIPKSRYEKPDPLFFIGLTTDNPNSSMKQGPQMEFLLIECKLLLIKS